MALEKIGSVGDFKKGQGKVVKVKDHTIAVFDVDGNLYAIDNGCPHREGPLGEGELDGNIIICPWHGWRFDVITGASPVNPAISVRKYDLIVKDNDVFVDID